MNTAKLITLGLLRGSGAAAPAFSPLDITGLVLWLDASDSTTLFQDDAGTTPATSDGDVVGYWADKSPIARHATQATLGSKPLLKLASFNSRRTVLFDGTATNLIFTSLNLTSFTIFGAYQATSLPRGINYWLGGSNVGCYAGGTAGGINGYGYFAGANRQSDEEPLTAGIVTFQNAALFRNGVEATYTATGTAAALTVAMIGNRLALDFGMIGPISEVIIYAATLTTAQRQGVEAYMNAKWAVF